MIDIDRLDHLVLTVRDVNVTATFYERVLGFRRVSFGDGRTAIHFGRQKFNLHREGGGTTLVAGTPMPGFADLCLVSLSSISEVTSHLDTEGIEIIEGPAIRTGALGPMISVYFRDPDQILIEVSCYEDAS